MSFEWRLRSRRSMAVGGSAGAKAKRCGQDRGGGVPVSHQLPTHHHLSLRPGSPAAHSPTHMFPGWHLPIPAASLGIPT